MARGDGHDCDRLLDEAFILGLHERVRFIIKDITCKSKLEIAEQLENELSTNLLEETRNYMFEIAKDKYVAHLREHNITGVPSLTMINRIGKRKLLQKKEHVKKSHVFHNF